MRWWLVMLVTGSVVASPIERRVAISTDLFEDRMASRQPIPQWVLNEARCVASVRVVRAGFIFGGEGSTGLLSCRLPNGQGWSAPSFLNLGGPSIGFQIGVQFAETILAFLSDQSRRLLMGPSIQLSGDLSVTAGPIGEGAGVGAIPRAHVFSYSRSQGLYAGLTLTGQIISHGPRRNQAVYGQKWRGYEILATPAHAAPRLMHSYTNALSRFAP